MCVCVHVCASGSYKFCVGAKVSIISYTRSAKQIEITTLRFAVCMIAQARVQFGASRERRNGTLATTRMHFANVLVCLRDVFLEHASVSSPRLGGITDHEIQMHSPTRKSTKHNAVDALFAVGTQAYMLAFSVSRFVLWLPLAFVVWRPRRKTITPLRIIRLAFRCPRPGQQLLPGPVAGGRH